METFPLDKSTIKSKPYTSDQLVITLKVDHRKYYVRDDIKRIQVILNAIMGSSSLHGSYLEDDNEVKVGLVVFNDDEIFGTFGLVERDVFEICASYSKMNVKRVHSLNDSYNVIRLLWQRTVDSPTESYFSKSTLYSNQNNEPALFKENTKYTLTGYNHCDTIVAILEDGGYIEFEYVRSKLNSLELSIIKNISNIDLDDINAKKFFEYDFELRNGDKSSYFLCVCIDTAPNDNIKNKLLSYI